MGRETSVIEKVSVVRDYNSRTLPSKRKHIPITAPLETLVTNVLCVISLLTKIIGDSSSHAFINEKTRFASVVLIHFASFVRGWQVQFLPRHHISTVHLNIVVIDDEIGRLRSGPT